MVRVEIGGNVGEILNLLTGMKMSKRCRRPEYLVNLHSGEFGNVWCLDVHSIKYAGLVRCKMGRR